MQTASNILAAPLDLPAWLFNVIFPVNRWLHLVASTLLVGGVLFFEFVVPIATEDLPHEQQLSVFGRARWIFRRVAWFSAIALLITGALSLWRMWWTYSADQAQVQQFWLGSKPWALGHIILGGVAFVALLRVTNTTRIRSHPVGWMRGILVVLFSSMFLASVARQVRLHIREWRDLQAPPHSVHGPSEVKSDPPRPAEARGDEFHMSTTSIGVALSSNSNRQQTPHYCSLEEAG